MAPALEIIDLTAGYDGLPIVRNFSAQVQAGTVTTLIGGNGAGKSTLMRAIYGSNRWFSGKINFNGRAIERTPPWERLRMGIGFVPQGRCNFGAMSVAENLKAACYTLPRHEHDAAIEPMLELFPFLRGKLQMMAGNLSGGEQQMLETAMVMALKPRLLLLDEPSLGLSPKMQQEVFATARMVAATGVTVLMVEQNVYGALRISDTAIVLELGRKFMEGPAREIMEDPRVRHAYLGGNLAQAVAAHPDNKTSTAEPQGKHP